MTTIDEALPISITPRPLRFGDAPTDPVAIVRGELARMAGEKDTLLGEIACHWFQLKRLSDGLADGRSTDETLAEGLQILFENLKDVLDQHGIEARNMSQLEFGDATEPLVDVTASSVNEDIDQPLIVHTESPAVLRHGRIIRKAAVLVESPRRATPDS